MMRLVGWGMGLVSVVGRERMWRRWEGRGCGEGGNEGGVRAQENPSASSKVPAPGLLRAGPPPGGYLLVFRPSMISLNVEDGRITAFVFSSFGQ